MNKETLIANAPAELLLGLIIFFGLVAIILFVLSVEAGNYSELTQWLRNVRGTGHRSRLRRRWYFSTRSAGTYANNKPRLAD